MSGAFKSLLDRVAPGAAPASTPAPRVVTLPPSAFADTWKDRPRDVSKVGLRLIGEEEYADAERAAGRDAWRLFPEDRDVERRRDAFDAALKRELLVFAMCEPGNVDAPYFKRTPNATIMVALRDATIARLFEELEQLSASSSPLVREASDDEMMALGAVLSTPSLLERLTDDDAQRVRRLASYLSAELAAVGIVAPEPIDEA